MSSWRCYLFFFFFSSRRRHTRSYGDWSSDVCSSDLKRTVARARKIEKFLSQPMFVAAQFTGLEGKYVKIEDTVRSFKEIVEGKYDDVPEQAFYMVGTIEEALEKAEKMKASA